jgi:hypothetical protein
MVLDLIQMQLKGCRSWPISNDLRRGGRERLRVGVGGALVSGGNRPPLLVCGESWLPVPGSETLVCRERQARVPQGPY